MNLLTKTTELAMAVTCAYLQEGDFAVDATCGNGYDTVRLAGAVGAAGKVLAVDIQRQAVEATETALEARGLANTVLRQANFKDLAKLVSETFPGQEPAAVVFNLGYLPGGDKGITTGAEDSCAAVKEALNLICDNGIVTVVLYSGHEEGAREKEAILRFARELSAKSYHVVYTNMLNQKNAPPEILWITRKKR